MDKIVAFPLSRLDLQEALKRIEELKDICVLPMDEDGRVIDDDELAHDSARELRLLLQRVLDLDTEAFLTTMKSLYFHLFAVDHDHYRDLILQAARQKPEMVKDFALEFLTSEGVLFLDDQESLHDLLDALEFLGLGILQAPDVERLKALWARPFFRLPSIHGRLARWLRPTLQEPDRQNLKRLFEMDLIDPRELRWSDLDPHSPQPAARPVALLSQVDLEAFEELRWGVGIEGPPTAMRLRMLGALAAVGPMAPELFLQSCEAQPETAFERKNFLTAGQEIFFRQGLSRLASVVSREAHHSREWFIQPHRDREWPWATQEIPDPWPQHLRHLAYYWSEFANQVEGSEFSQELGSEIREIDERLERLGELMKKQSLPTTEMLAEGDLLFEAFQRSWAKILGRLLPRLDVLP